MSTIVELCSVRIAGLRYYGFHKLVYPEKLVGEFCHFVNEPTNPHDCHAVVVMYQDLKLGHIPKPYNEIIFSLVEQLPNLRVGGEVTAVDTEHPYVILKLLLEV